MMPQTVRTFIILGSLFAFAGIALGAFAAHLLKDRLTPEMFQIYEVGIRYHIYHVPAIFLVAILATLYPNLNTAPAGWLFVVGIILFSGSLYALSLTEVRILGAITPLGGLCFLAGWLWLAWVAMRAS